MTLHALIRPWLLGALLGLRLRVRQCADRLSNAAVFILLSDGKAPPRGMLG